MKNILVIIIFIIVGISAHCQNNNPNYDSVLSKSLGADKYGMKSYILVMLKTGTNSTTNETFIDSCFTGHMSNIKRLVDEGKLIVAGPIGRNENTYRGIFILNVPGIQEASQLLQSDPAIHEKLLEPELYEWYGSAALPLYLKDADKIWNVQP